MSALNPVGAAGLLAYSDVESKRFGYDVYRAKLGKLDAEQLSSEILAKGVDILIVRLPSDRQHELYRLGRLGFPYLVADNLVYYVADLTRHTPVPLRNEALTFVRCTPDRRQALGTLTDEIFADYVNHYGANPLFQRTDILAAYADWAGSFAGGEKDARLSWIAQLDGEDVAFCTCSQTGTDCEGVLYGVRPSASGRGVYGDLIRFTQRHLRDQGCTRMSVSTQTQNLAVQKVWVREGFRVAESLVTVHINSLLSRSVEPLFAEDLYISPDEIERCGEFSGDRNPLHFDDEFARAAGFDSRIAHGVIPAARISRFYGTRFRAPGTVFIGYSYKFMKPIYPGRTYQLEFRFPFADKARGIYKSLATVRDSDGEYCLLAYSDLRRRPA